MFYSQVILARKGSLSKIWLAAHFEKKLSKNQIFSTDIVESVDSLLNPSMGLALRVSGHLMLGIVRIYSKKMKYLMVDCSEALWKINLAFKPGIIDVEAAAVSNVDDNRHYGNVTDDVDMRLLDNSGFNPPLLPTLTISRLGYLDEDSIVSDVSSDYFEQLTQHSVSFATPNQKSETGRLEIEEVRAASESSFNASRSSMSVDHIRSSNIGAQLDDDLPRFEDEDIEVSFSQQENNYILSLPDVSELAIANDQVDNSEVMIGPTAKQVSISKTKKVKIDNRTELSEKEMRERIKNPSVGLREVTSVFKREVPSIVGLEMFSEGLCDDLLDVYRVATNVAPFPFQPRKRLSATSGNPRESFLVSPEETRRGSFRDSAPLEISPNKLASSMNDEILNVASFKESSFSSQIDSMVWNPMDIEIENAPNATISSNNCLPARAENVKEYLTEELKEKDIVHLNDLLRNCNKRTASKKFLQLLNLHSNGEYKMTQLKPYSDITIAMT